MLQFRKAFVYKMKKQANQQHERHNKMCNKEGNMKCTSNKNPLEAIAQRGSKKIS
jgi:hypothetical protein